LLELQYLPPIISFKILLNETNIGFPLYERYRKMSFENRAIIPAANSLTTLSIPLAGGRETRQILREVRIDNTQDWQIRHWRTISSAYRRSPWFEYYEPELSTLYQTQYEFLYQWNLDLMKWVLRMLKTESELRILASREADGYSWEVQNNLKPSNFQDRKFTQDLPVYAQVFQDRSGFQANVSIIDLLFNEGNKSRSLLTGAST
ncbi:MAG TPA: WbqC family protein, partial [Chitinophagaceae bacterium]|nr:WbqC family protein [Chitinophagaceae bacterium]